MYKQQTTKDETELLKGINGKLSALLSIALRNSPQATEKRGVANTATVKFLADCGLELGEIANVLGTTRDSVGGIVRRNKKRKK